MHRIKSQQFLEFVENCWYLGDTIRASGGANDNLKIRLKKPIGNQQVYSFQNKMELAEILAKLDLDGYQLVNHDFDES